MPAELCACKTLKRASHSSKVSPQMLVNAAFVYPALIFFFPKSCWNNLIIPDSIFDFFFFFFLLRREPCFCALNIAWDNSGQLVYHMAEVTRRGVALGQWHFDFFYERKVHVREQRFLPRGQGPACPFTLQSMEFKPACKQWQNQGPVPELLSLQCDCISWLFSGKRWSDVVFYQQLCSR